MKKLPTLILALAMALAGALSALASEALPDFWGLYKVAEARNDKAAMDAVRRDMPYALYAAPKDGLWGYINFLGEWIIEPRWAYVGEFRNGVAMVSLTDWWHGGEPAYGIIDKIGTYLVPPKYLMDEGQEGTYFGGKENGHILLEEKFPDGSALTGYYDVEHHFFVKPQWINVSLYDCGTDLLGVLSSENGKWGYVKKSTVNSYCPMPGTILMLLLFTLAGRSWKPMTM